MMNICRMIDLLNGVSDIIALPRLPFSILILLCGQCGSPFPPSPRQ